jgi:O-antigen/teichoic acid export membrane protein
MKDVLQNLASVLGGEAAVRLANVAVVLFIARGYGGTVLGAYAVSVAMVTVVVMFADNGLQIATITQLSDGILGRNHTVGRLTLAKTVMLVAAIILLVVIATWTARKHLIWEIGFWVALRTVVQSYSQLQMAILKSVSRAKVIGIIQFLHSFILFLGIWCAFKLSWNLFTLLGWVTFCQFVELVLGLGVLYRSGILPRWPERLHLVTTLKMAAPFGIAYGLANLIIRSDTIILSTFTSLAGVGVFSAANTILLMVYVSSWLFSSVLLPEMVRLARKPESLVAYSNQWVRWVLWVTVPGALLLSVAAPRALILFYGANFASSGLVGSAMALACPFILLNSIYTARALAVNRRSVFLGIYGVGVLATVALDSILGRAFGPLGIAVAIVLREAGILFGFWLLLSYPAPSTAELKVRAVPEELETPLGSP